MLHSITVDMTLRADEYTDVLLKDAALREIKLYDLTARIVGDTPNRDKRVRLTGTLKNLKGYAGEFLNMAEAEVDALATPVRN